MKVSNKQVAEVVGINCTQLRDLIIENFITIVVD